jgi:hypothetical protein
MELNVLNLKNYLTKTREDQGKRTGKRGDRESGYRIGGKIVVQSYRPTTEMLLTTIYAQQRQRICQCFRKLK